MPSKSFKKKPFYKKKNPVYTRTVYQRTLSTRSLLPSVFPTKLKYVEDRIDLTAGIGTMAVHVFSANGVYDPNITGAGHQPRGFDQLMSMFNHYTAVRGTIHVTFINYAGVAEAGNVGICLRDVSTAASLVNTYLEDRHVTTALLKPVTGGNYPDPITLSYSFDAKKFLGRKDPMSDPDLKGSVTTNPAEAAYYHVFYKPTLSLAASIQAQVTLFFDCFLAEPVQPAQS